MANEYSTVTCFERFGTATEEYDDERGLMSASVQLFCDYDSRHDLAGDILFNHRPWPKGSSSIVPMAYGAAIQPWEDVGSASGQMINPGTALVTIRYSIKRVELITESIEPTSEFITLDHELFVWSSTEALVRDEAPGFLIRGINFVQTESFVAPPLAPELLSLPGSVNDVSFSSGLLGLTFDVETLLFAPPVISIKYNSVGDLQYDLVKKFTYKPQGWNKFFRMSTFSWEDMFYVGDLVNPYKPYPTADLSPVLKYQTPYTP